MSEVDKKLSIINDAIDDKKGILKVLLQGNLNEMQRNNVYIVLSTMELGIKNLMESYPENVRLEDEEV